MMGVPQARIFSHASKQTKQFIMEPAIMSNQEPMSSALPPATGSTHINVGVSERVVSALGGAALAVWGLRSINSGSGITMLLGGTYLLVRGLSGYCPMNEMLGRNTAEMPRNTSAMEARTTFTINKPRSEVYRYWRTLENLPNFMQHLESVKELDDRRSKWSARIPGADKVAGNLATVSWEAEIIEDKKDELIAWSSLPASTIDNAGEVHFRDARDNRGTEIEACISYRLPAGDLGSMAAKLFNPAIERMIQTDLRNFKMLMETGQISNFAEGRTADVHV